VILAEHIDGANFCGVREKLQSCKKYVKNLALFLEPKIVVSNHHVYHAFHHDLTTEKPRFARTFSQKPLQKRSSTTTKISASTGRRI
jgi:hypothetical protein